MTNIDRNNITLGAECRDSVTGFTGLVTGIADYLTGCSQAILQPKVDDKGEWKTPHWFDVDRLVVIESQAHTHTTKTARGGPSQGAPIK